ncbi:major facilitator superfamily domain-containing protein, partial [Dimargaris cristalligena]
DFGISNTQYGLLQSAVSLVNTVLPVLGGLFIDAFGTSSGSILATSFILIGTSVVAMSTHYQSFPIMVVGRLLYGLGSGTIVTIQETILSHWFTGKGLAMTIALQIATARLASFLSMGTTVPIANATGFYGYAFWASAFICLCSWIINFVYVMLMKRVDEHMTEHELAKLKRKNTFRLRHVLIFPAAYWLIVALSFVLGSGWTTFLHISSELVKLRFGCDDSTAAHIASVSQLLPVILVPFLGLWVDRNGHRVTLLILAASLFLGTIILLGFTTLPPAVGMFVFSVSLSVGPISSISSIPLVLPLSTVGSGLGLFKSAQNIGNTILDIIIGQLQDAHPLRGHSYDRVMVFYLYWGGLTLLVALTLYAIDRLGWDRLLQLS